MEGAYLNIDDMKLQDIKDEHDYIDVACCLLDEFMESLLEEDWAVRKPYDYEVEEFSEEGVNVQYMWRYRATELYERYRVRLAQLGMRKFPNLDDSQYLNCIFSSNVKEL